MTILQSSELKKIIDEWKINRALLASKIGLSKGAFNNKLNEVKTYRLTDSELNRLCNVLIEMRDSLGVVESANPDEKSKIEYTFTGSPEYGHSF